MTNMYFSTRATLAAATVLAGSLLRAAPAISASETVLYSFAGQKDGATPQGQLLLDSAGNIYGTTQRGGLPGHDVFPRGQGTVFRIAADGKKTTMIAFNGSDGAQPVAGLAADFGGNIYGTTEALGANGYGTLFRLAPNGTETVLVAFDNANTGAYPLSNLIRDSAGNLFGTTFEGGPGGGGVIFKLAPDNIFSIVYSLNPSQGDGWGVWNPITFDASGNFYGMTVLGGKQNSGTLFKVTQDETETVLFSFPSEGLDGGGSPGGLVVDSQGNLYGTTIDGGPKGNGVLFEFTSGGTYKILHEFAGSPSDGATPWAGLIADQQGDLYGTTVYGGTRGRGTLFRYSPDGTETVLFNFAGISGERAWGLPVFDARGNLYGTTAHGGQFGAGTVWKVTP
jgi:uncharacterized repeat protein (TIGR03803 family)